MKYKRVILVVFLSMFLIGCGGSDSAVLVTEPTPEQEQKMKDQQLAVDQQERARKK